MQVYLNGEMVDHGDAHIGVEDAGLQHAVGLFETMGVYHGRVFRLQAHLDRLRGSAQALGLAGGAASLGGLGEAVEETVRRNQLDRARLRLTVTAGQASLLRDSSVQQPAGPTLLIVPSEPTVYDLAYFEEGIMAVVAPGMANPFDPLAGHKALSYWGRLRTLRQAAAIGAGEAIWLTPTNHLASGAVSNLFLVKGDQLLTPIARGEEAQGALPAPVLPGVTRAAVIELAESIGLSVVRRMLDINDLLDADEAFLTNAGWLVLPVTRVEKKTLGGGRVGAVTLKLRQALLDLIEQETQG